jgi:hypothetical protein
MTYFTRFAGGRGRIVLYGEERVTISTPHAHCVWCASVCIVVCVS